MEGNAPNPPTNDDIEELIGYTRKKVLDLTKIFLETEIKIIGEY